jgi:hypothetical protein
LVFIFGIFGRVERVEAMVQDSGKPGFSQHAVSVAIYEGPSGDRLDSTVGLKKNLRVSPSVSGIYPYHMALTARQSDRGVQIDGGGFETRNFVSPFFYMPDYEVGTDGLNNCLAISDVGERYENKPSIVDMKRSLNEPYDDAGPVSCDELLPSKRELFVAGAIEGNRSTPQSYGRNGQYEIEQGDRIARRSLPKGFAFLVFVAGLFGGLVTLILLSFCKSV